MANPKGDIYELLREQTLSEQTQATTAAQEAAQKAAAKVASSKTTETEKQTLPDIEVAPEPTVEPAPEPAPASEPAANISSRSALDAALEKLMRQQYPYRPAEKEPVGGALSTPEPAAVGAPQLTPEDEDDVKTAEAVMGGG
jgi:hypothetical protein